MQFSVPINSLLDRDLYTEAAISAVTAYKATPQDQQNIGSWHAVSPLELGLNAESDEFSMLGGVFSCNGLFDKIATVCSGVIDGKKTILITFKGTNLPDVIDLMADLSSSQFQRYYNAFRDLIDAVETYISDNSSDVDRVLISGHSLGGALAEKLVAELNEKFPAKVEGITFGSIGDNSTANVSNIVNFAHVSDIANQLAVIHSDPDWRNGTTVWLNRTDLADSWSIGWTPSELNLASHDKFEYQKV